MTDHPNKPPRPEPRPYLPQYPNKRGWNRPRFRKDSTSPFVLS